MGSHIRRGPIFFRLLFDFFSRMGQDDNCAGGLLEISSTKQPKNYVVYSATSENGSLLSDNVEVCQLSESFDDHERKQAAPNRSKNRQKRQVQDNAANDKTKSLVDPRKYKTKMCRNWKATGQCPYEHTCCYAHGDLETRTVQQNNNVLSSLGYFSGIMLLAMKDDKQGPGKPPRPAKKGAQKAVASLTLPQPQAPQPPTPTGAANRAHLAPNTPTVHSPYCLPGEGPSFGTESAPGSPLTFADAQMPSYSFRMEGYPKPPAYASFEGLGHYEGYGLLPSPYGPYTVENPPPMAYHTPDYPTYDYAQRGAPYSQEAHQAAMEKHPAVRNLQSGDMSQKQLQKVLQDIMYSNNAKQKKPRKKMSQSEVPEE